MDGVGGILRGAYAVDLDAKLAADLALRLPLEEGFVRLGVREQGVVSALEHGVEGPVGDRWRDVRVRAVA